VKQHPLKYDYFPTDFIHLLGRWLFSVFTFIVFKTYTRIIIHDRNRLPKGAFIICSNHQSHLDGIILSFVGCHRFDKTAMIAAKDYWFDNRKRSRFARLFFNIIPINRKVSTDSFNMLEAARAADSFVKDKGKCIVMLPEGTRSKDGTIHPFKKGIVTLAKATQLPIVPVYIHNSGRFWPKGSIFLRPGTIHVFVGNPIFPEALKQADAVDIIQSSVLSLSKNEQ
jgi:1-acyl-sn-glycerol-3-phosphate acyltransferase